MKTYEVPYVIEMYGKTLVTASTPEEAYAKVSKELENEQFFIDPAEIRVVQ